MSGHLRLISSRVDGVQATIHFPAPTLKVLSSETMEPQSNELSSDRSIIETFERLFSTAHQKLTRSLLRVK